MKLQISWLHDQGSSDLMIKDKYFITLLPRDHDRGIGNYIMDKAKPIPTQMCAFVFTTARLHFQYAHRPIWEELRRITIYALQTGVNGVKVVG